MIETLIARARSIDIDMILDNTINQRIEFLLDLVRSQLLSGERSDGTPIGTYSKSEIGKYYVDLKFDMGLFKGGSDPNYDLYFDGTYHKSLTAKVTSDSIEIWSTDPKEPEIEMNTGSLDNALVLNEENLQLFIDELIPLIKNDIYGKLGI